MDMFIHKTISDSVLLQRPKVKPSKCVVTRTRTSAGYCCISVNIDGATSLNLSTDDYGAHYEQAAQDVADLLRRIADTCCTLPEGEA